LGDLSTGLATRVTRTVAGEQHPSWSPDGTRIAVAGGVPIRGAGGEVSTYTIDGSCHSQLTWMGPWIGNPSYVPGAGTATSHAGCGSAPARYQPAVNAHDAGRSILYPGLRYHGALLSDVSGGSLIYDECAIALNRCPSLDLQAWSICQRYPGKYGSPGHPFKPSRVWRRRSAIIAVWPTSGGFDVYTGSTALAVFGVPTSRATAFVNTLRRPGQSSAHGNLPAPRVRTSLLSELLRSFETWQLPCPSTSATPTVRRLPSLQAHERPTACRLYERTGAVNRRLRLGCRAAG
jgi:hypothetical protein